MQFSSIITLLFSLCVFTSAYTCAPWVLPADCLKEAAAFAEKMKSKPEGKDNPDAPAAAIIPGPPAPPPKHRNCGTLGIMDADDAACDRMYRPAARPPPVPSPAPQVEAEKEERVAGLKRLAVPLQT